MADRIKGITVQIGGDTTGLSKALKDTNKEIKSTKSQLKDVEKLLKLDPKNTELLAQKQKLLNDAVGETKTKLDTLKEAEKQVQEQFKNGEVSEQQYNSLKREIEATQLELKDLETQAKQTASEMNSIADVSQKVADGANKVASATRGLSTAAAGGLTALAGLAVKSAQAADDLNTLAKQSGFSTDEIQKWQYASDLVDVSVDDIVGAAKKLKKNMAGTGKVFEELGVAVKDSATGEFRDATDVFYDTIEALSKIENETERDVVAMEIFGKSADSLAGIVDDGGAALKALGEEAEEAGLILSEDTLNSANEFNDAMDKLKATTKGQFMEIGAEIATSLTPILENLAEVVGNVVGWFANLTQGQQETILIILAVIAAISPLASVIGAISTAISFLASTVIPALSAALSFLAANPIVLIIAAIVALIALIVTFQDEILDGLGSVDEFLQGVFVKDWSESFGILGDLLNGFFAAFSGIWDGIKQIFGGIIDFIAGVFTGNWSQAWEGIKSIFKGIFDALVGIAKAPLNLIIGIINGLITGINFLVKGLNKIKFNIPDWVPAIGGKSFGFNIPEIGKIPYLAKGGVLSNGSAIVGENGAEILTNVGGKSVVQPLSASGNTAGNLDTIVSTLNAYLPYLASGTQLVLDTGELVGATAPAMNREFERISIREAGR